MKKILFLLLLTISTTAYSQINFEKEGEYMSEVGKLYSSWEYPNLSVNQDGKYYIFLNFKYGNVWLRDKISLGNKQQTIETLAFFVNIIEQKDKTKFYDFVDKESGAHYRAEYDMMATMRIRSLDREIVSYNIFLKKSLKKVLRKLEN